MDGCGTEHDNEEVLVLFCKLEGTGRLELDANLNLIRKARCAA